MKKYLLTILLPVLVSCAGKHKPITIKTLWQCESNTVVISAHGYYAKVRDAKYELYQDANTNGVFDDVDEMIGYSINMQLVHNDYYLSQPIKLDSTWSDKKLFVRVICGSDTAMSEISRCSASVSDFRQSK